MASHLWTGKDTAGKEQSDQVEATTVEEEGVLMMIQSRVAQS
jgi:hypothetical protein